MDETDNTRKGLAVPKGLNLNDLKDSSRFS